MYSYHCFLYECTYTLWHCMCTLTPQAVNSQVEVTGDDPTAVRDIKQLSFNIIVCISTINFYMVDCCTQVFECMQSCQFDAVRLSRRKSSVRIVYYSWTLCCHSWISMKLSPLQGGHVPDNLMFFFRPPPVLTVISLVTSRSMFPKKAASYLQKVRWLTLTPPPHDS